MEVILGEEEREVNTKAKRTEVVTRRSLIARGEGYGNPAAACTDISALFCIARVHSTSSTSSDSIQVPCKSS